MMRWVWFLCLASPQQGELRLSDSSSATQFCEIKNDPSLQTYSNEADQFPFPCRYLASHVRTDLISMYGNTIGVCEARVYAFNSKSKGKFYVSGFDVGITFITYNPPNATRFSYRRFVTTANHVNTASRNGHIGQAVPFIHDGTQNITFQTSDGIGLTSSYQNTNNRFVFKALGCGITVSLVPYDSVLRLIQPQIPGLTVAIEEPHSELTFSEHLSLLF
ncbi:hypothetical protein PoB_006051700 [Plakobranchus ocellatus]|uniref:Uncharacterized protein n=1 Tax=Plakobranchus ocellatus TaxID=259542 RepID=A0AAV4CQ70_9GAST|nr:hypothetical protein PoB_006051700 [Plakobranchus ocellatus]